MEQSDSKLNIIILEDDCERIRAFSSMFVKDNMIVTNCAETAILFLNSYKFDYVFLDHDLGGEVFVNPDDKNTGSEVCKQINDLNKNATFIIHSWNNVGAEIMKSELLLKGFPTIIRKMFSEDLIEDIKGQLK